MEGVGACRVVSRGSMSAMGRGGGLSGVPRPLCVFHVQPGRVAARAEACGSLGVESDWRRAGASFGRASRDGTGGVRQLAICGKALNRLGAGGQPISVPYHVIQRGRATDDEEPRQK